MSHEAYQQPGPLFGRIGLREPDMGFIPQSRLRAAQAAAERADREVGPGWAIDASAYLLAYAATQGEWLTEDVVARWDAAKLPAPPDARSWGAVVAALSRAGKITKAGYKLDGFGSPKPIWTLKRP